MSSVDKQFGDEFAPAPPGHSLTNDNSQWPWGRPAQHANPDDALDELMVSLEKPQRQKEMFKLLMVGVSIEAMVEGLVFTGFQDGKFTPDVAMLIKGPLSLFIADMAEENSIPYRLFENENTETANEMDDETFLQLMLENNPRMFEGVREAINMTLREGRKPPEEKGFLTEGDK